MSRPLDEEEPSLLLILLDSSSAFWTKREANRRRQNEACLKCLSLLFQLPAIHVVLCLLCMYPQHTYQVDYWQAAWMLRPPLLEISAPIYSPISWCTCNYDRREMQALNLPQFSELCSLAKSLTEMANSHCICKHARSVSCVSASRGVPARYSRLCDAELQCPAYIWVVSKAASQ